MGKQAESYGSLTTETQDALRDDESGLRVWRLRQKRKRKGDALVIAYLAQVKEASSSTILARVIAVQNRLRLAFARGLRAQSGQGTTEYAILVGVLVVIAIIAITAFKGKLQDLWSQIATGINGL